MKADFKMSIDGDKVKVIVTRPGEKKPKVIYSGKGKDSLQPSINAAQNTLINEIQQVKGAITQAAIKAAQKKAAKKK